MTEQFPADHVHTTPEGRHFRHGDGAEVDGEGETTDPEYYYALFVDAAAMEAWIRRLHVTEPAREGRHGGQSYGTDYKACREALRGLCAAGYAERRAMPI